MDSRWAIICIEGHDYAVMDKFSIWVGWGASIDKDRTCEEVQFINSKELVPSSENTPQFSLCQAGGEIGQNVFSDIGDSLKR